MPSSRLSYLPGALVEVIKEGMEDLADLPKPRQHRLPHAHGKHKEGAKKRTSGAALMNGSSMNV